jgi:ABC-type multidrug transport system fused ATPase/permease subunit
MPISNLEKEACIWWVTLGNLKRRSLRILICFAVTILAGIIQLSAENSIGLLLGLKFLKILESQPGLPLMLLLTFSLTFVFSVMLTRIAKDKVTSERANENLAKVNEELAIRNEELSESYQKLEESQQLLQEAHEELRKANKLNKENSLRDGMTGLHNRRYLDDLMPTIESRSLRAKKEIS